MCFSQGPDGHSGDVGETGLPGSLGEKVPEKHQTEKENQHHN